jgi:hypothetical protein
MAPLSETHPRPGCLRRPRPRAYQRLHRAGEQLRLLAQHLQVWVVRLFVVDFPAVLHHLPAACGEIAEHGRAWLIG